VEECMRLNVVIFGILTDGGLCADHGFNGCW
jgi:hypothetical protein